jgi:hypothetical protein
MHFFGAGQRPVRGRVDVGWRGDPSGEPRPRCVGTKSNRSAIGARVTVTTGEHRQTAEVMSGSSYHSQSDLRLHFGLGPAAAADSVELRWPAGATEAHRDLPAGHLFVIEEGKGIVSRKKLGS